MNLGVEPEWEPLVSAFTTFLAREVPIARVRAAEPTGYDPQLWSQLLEMGAPALLAPAQSGGSGLPLSAVVPLAEAFGRHLAPVPLLDHLAATRLVTTWADDAEVGALLASRQPIAIAPYPATDGVFRNVPAGAVATAVIGLANGRVVLVAQQPSGAVTRNFADQPMADVTIDDGAILVDDGADAQARVDAALDDLRILVASSLVGLAARALEIGVEYVKQRHQFGQPIGSFQAIQHGLAGLVGPIDGARLLVGEAAWSLDGDVLGGIEEYPPAALASMALAFAADTAAATTDRALHYHGGYGYSLEFDVQLYYRRARGWPLAIGGPVAARHRVSELVFGGRR